MTFQILNIVVYNKYGNFHAITLKLNSLNIISGEGKSGKSALLSIVEYCLGSNKCRVPLGIREYVSWYGLKLFLSDEKWLFVARQNPEAGKDKSDNIYLNHTITEKEIPTFEMICANVSSEDFQTSLLEIIGISQNQDSSIMLLDSLDYCFQSQDEMGTHDHLFHQIPGSKGREKRIKEILPYILTGKFDRINKPIINYSQQKFDNTFDNNIDLENTTIRPLLNQARVFGIIPDNILEEQDTWTVFQNAVQSINERMIYDLPEIHDENGVLSELKKKQELLDERCSLVKSNLVNLKESLSLSGNYKSAAQKQIGRLESIGIIEQEGDRHRCPLCFTYLSTSSPSIDHVRSRLKQLKFERDSVSESLLPSLKEHIEKLETELRELNKERKNNHRAINELKQEDENLLKSERVYIDQIILSTKIQQTYLILQQQMENTVLSKQIPISTSENRNIQFLENSVITEEIQEYDELLAECLSDINAEITQYARDLNIEYSEYGFEFDTRKLELYAKTSPSHTSFQGMGSGINGVALHVILHLALHKWFAENKRPIPSFVFFDQPSQAYSNSTIGSKEANEYNKLIKLIADKATTFQVIVTEQKNNDDKWYANYVREDWRGESKLLPESWKIHAEKRADSTTQVELDI